MAESLADQVMRKINLTFAEAGVLHLKQSQKG
jgi:hypothetical protein